MPPDPPPLGQGYHAPLWPPGPVCEARPVLPVRRIAAGHYADGSGRQGPKRGQHAVSATVVEKSREAASPSSGSVVMTSPLRRKKDFCANAPPPRCGSWDVRRRKGDSTQTSIPAECRPVAQGPARSHTLNPTAVAETGARPAHRRRVARPESGDPGAAILRSEPPAPA